jgi:predicted outer membrane repeat protein
MQEELFNNGVRLCCELALLWLVWHHLRGWERLVGHSRQAASRQRGPTRQRHPDSPRDCPQCIATGKQDGIPCRDFSTNAIVINSTFSGNSAAAHGGAIAANCGVVTLSNTIMAHSPTGGNCYGTITSGGNNLDSGNTCAFAARGDRINTIPRLGPLANNGGTTQTMALMAGSPAIDAGNNLICAAPPVNNVDQRGVGRPIDGNENGIVICDIGAFEAQPLSSSAPGNAPTFQPPPR